MSAADAFFALHSDLPREGPGCAAATRRALAMAGPLPTHARVLDLGCGPGAQTLVLAEALPEATLLALDAHPPFLAEVARRAAAAGVGDRVTPCTGDLHRLDQALGRFDLLWCEGAAYLVGFEAALAGWRAWLRPEGVIALTEPVWQTDHPSPAVARLWAGYPAMTNVADRRAAILSAGYRLLGDFALPAAAWWDDYYAPMAAKLPALRRRFADQPAARAVLADAAAEIDCHRAHPDEVAYHFFVLRA